MRAFLAAAVVLAASPALAAPTVSMTSPANGALYLAPGTLPVKANASAPGVGVNRVEFYANGVLVQTDTTSPYQFDWTGVAAGTYAITAKAVDNNGGETTSAPRNVTVAGTNTPPTVSLSGPADNARYLNPSSITLSATASGPELNDLLQKVEFFLNGSLAGTVSAAPWSFSLPSPAVGTHSLTAVATDSQGGQTTSTPRTLIISDTNLAPTVSIVTPVDNSNWHAPASFMFQASASSGEANDTVTVEFYVNGALQGSDTTSPYSVNLSSLAAGTYVLMAKAIDGQGAQASSVTRTITISDTNAAPTININAPSGNTNFPTAPAGFTFSATASAGESNGWIARVEFYINGSLVSTDTAGPWSYPVAGLANGTYQLTAKAVDQLGGETTTIPMTVTVGPQPKLHFIHVDHLNIPRAVFDDQQQLRWRWEQQEPFADSSPDENPSGLGIFKLPLRYPGQYDDEETNLHYNMARDYWPEGGRYVQSDPIALAGGINTYAYAIGNPLTLSDPTGNCPWCLGAIAGGLIGGGTTLYAQLQGSGPINWYAIGLSVVGGAVSGGTGAWVGTLTNSVWRAGIAGGVINTATGAATTATLNACNGDPIDANLAQSLAANFALGFAGGAAGQILANAGRSMQAQINQMKLNSLFTVRYYSPPTTSVAPAFVGIGTATGNAISNMGNIAQ